MTRGIITAAGYGLIIAGSTYLLSGMGWPGFALIGAGGLVCARHRLGFDGVPVCACGHNLFSHHFHGPSFCAVLSCRCRGWSPR